MTDSIDPRGLAGAFRARFGRDPRVYRAPGRVNLIGEHTDYNDGFVLPIALDRCTWVAAAPRADRTIVVHSREYGETVRVELGTPSPQSPQRHWSDYVRGIATILDRVHEPDVAGGFPAPPPPRYTRLVSPAPIS
jgi:galactokinase